MICPKCKAMLPNGLISCTKCGAVLQPNYKINDSDSSSIFDKNPTTQQTNTGTGQLYGQNPYGQQPNAGTGQLYGQNPYGQQPNAGTGQLYGQNPYGQQTGMGTGPLYNQPQQYQQQGWAQQNNMNYNQWGNGRQSNGSWVNGKWVPNGYGGAQPSKSGSNVVGIIVVVVLLVILLSGIGPALLRYIDKAKEEDDSATTQRNYTSTVEYDEETTEEITTEATTEAEPEINIKVAEDPTNMKVGDIGKKKDMYAGLAYVKLSDSFTTALDVQEEIGTDNQVLFAYFDVYNSGEKKQTVDDDDFSCYVDGTSRSKVETYFYYEEDGLTNKTSSTLYDNTCRMVITNFEIPKEWNEIKLYYGSDCIWVLSAEDMATEPYSFESMYDVDYVQEGTPEGTTIYSDKYEITYDGYEYVTSGYENDKYIIFKYTVNNTGSSELDYSLIGYNMNCYADNYALEDANYYFDDKVNGYENIFDVDSIQAGMNAQIYVAFEVDGEHDFYRMIYDAGYIDDDKLAEVYINEDTASDTDAE